MPPSRCGVPALCPGGAAAARRSVRVSRLCGLDLTWCPRGRAATLNGHLDAIRLLANPELGIGTEAKDKKGATALCLATEAGDLEAIRLLAELGADVETTNERGSTPLHWAAKFGKVETIAMLVQVTPWHPPHCRHPFHPLAPSRARGNPGRPS